MLPQEARALTMKEQLEIRGRAARMIDQHDDGEEKNGLEADLAKFQEMQKLQQSFPEDDPIRYAGVGGGSSTSLGGSLDAAGGGGRPHADDDPETAVCAIGALRSDGGDPQLVGSGFVVDGTRRLIVSCAHVWNDAESWCSAKLPAGFLDPAEEGVAIGFSSGPGLPIVWHGRAELRGRSDPPTGLDLVVLQVTQAFDGSLLPSDHALDALPLGDSSKLQPSHAAEPYDDLTVLGFGLPNKCMSQIRVPSAANSPSSIRSPGGSRRVCRRAGTVAGQCLAARGGCRLGGAPRTSGGVAVQELRPVELLEPELKKASTSSTPTAPPIHCASGSRWASASLPMRDPNKRQRVEPPPTLLGDPQGLPSLGSSHKAPPSPRPARRRRSSRTRPRASPGDHRAHRVDGDTAGDDGRDFECADQREDRGVDVLECQNDAIGVDTRVWCKPEFPKLWEQNSCACRTLSTTLSAGSSPTRSAMAPVSSTAPRRCDRMAR